MRSDLFARSRGCWGSLPLKARHSIPAKPTRWRRTAHNGDRASSRLAAGTIHAGLAQSAEAQDLGSWQCGFDSHAPHQHQRDAIRQTSVAQNYGPVGSSPTADTTTRGPQRKRGCSQWNGSPNGLKHLSPPQSPHRLGPCNEGVRRAGQSIGRTRPILGARGSRKADHDTVAHWACSSSGRAQHSHC